ncbi:MAG: hypothetical protein H6707_16890 [Deltaproteobacteria bacterium]|nr:hypothetical protein [Deltaproteobacteria bacterium]
MNASVLAISGQGRIRRQIRRALASAGWRVRAEPPDLARIDAALTDDYDMLIVDLEPTNEEDNDAFQALTDRICASKQRAVLVLSNDPQASATSTLLRTDGFNNLVARRGGLSTSEDLIDEGELIVTCQKLLRDDIFGLEKYMSTWGIAFRERSLTRSTDKSEALAELEGFLAEIDCHLGIIPAITQVADELLMNAVYNAPRDAQRQPKYARLDRRQLIELSAEETVRFRYGCDGRYVGLSVSDQFGSLDREVIAHYLERCFAGKPATIEDKLGGAGIGLHVIFSSITQLTFNIAPDQRTEAIAMFYVREGARAFRAPGRSLNIFVVGN